MTNSVYLKVDLSQLRQILLDSLNDNELRTLCFDLGVNYDELEGSGTAAKIRELIGYLDRRGQVLRLLQVGQQYRSDIPWWDLLEESRLPPVVSRSRWSPFFFGMATTLALVGLFWFFVLNPGSPFKPDSTPTVAATSISAASSTPTPTVAFKPSPTPTASPVAAFPPPFSSTPCPTSAPTATPTQTPSPTSVPEWKTNLSAGDQVAHTTTLIAEYTGNLEGDLWVFVVPSQGRFYPQSPDAERGAGTPRVGNKWEIRIGLGEPEDVGKKYDIVLAVARTPLDSQFIAGKLITWHDASEPSGFEDLPREVVEVHRIPGVVRTDEKWGPAPPVSNSQLEGEVNITNIDNSSLVTETTIFMGDYTNTTDDIWVLVHPGHGRWYPQSEFPCTGDHTRQEDGRWQVPVRFGEDEAKTFDVIVVLASEQASEFFDSRQRMWCRAGSYFGFLTIELPQGIDVKDRVRVFRE